MLVYDKLFIGGELVAPLGSGTIDVINASTEEIAGRAPEATTGDIDRAVAAAREAFDSGPWGKTSPLERAELLQQLSKGIQARYQEFAEVISTETGCPVSSSVMMQVFAATMVMDYYGGMGADFPFEEERKGVMGPVLVRREAVGVVGAIIPWNVPLFVTALKLAPALIAGCTVVLKPSPETALDSYLLAEVATEIGLPAGVLNIVTAGRETSQHLVTHPGVDKISFTGSGAAGRHIAALCAQDLRRVTLELGGKSAAVVLEDADLDATLGHIVSNGLMNNGQACIAQTRILAPSSRYNEVVDALAAKVGALKVGSALDATTEIGPLVANRQRDRVLGYIEKGKEQGARVVTGGGRPADQDRGWFVSPTVFADVDNHMTIAEEEIFGPVLSVISYDGPDDAVRIANDTTYGLSGAVYGEDVGQATDVARRLRTGTVAVNNMSPMDFAAPFGGFKQSGLGRELGPEGLQAYLEYKTITLPNSGPAVGA
ncbi:MAG TPA: aldehyde dehydrogenase [Frankiaceae bacterium]|nr:aldehyde dehydrogenase [Frankiaceae bacterium]